GFHSFFIKKVAKRGSRTVIRKISSSDIKVSSSSFFSLSIHLLSSNSSLMSASFDIVTCM
ncbi:22675_t:CDS:1, partial [Gigaspora rosea]